MNRGLATEGQVPLLLPGDLIDRGHGDADVPESAAGEDGPIGHVLGDGLAQRRAFVLQGARLVCGDPGAMLVGIVPPDQLALA